MALHNYHTSEKTVLSVTLDGGNSSFNVKRLIYKQIMQLDRTLLIAPWSESDQNEIAYWLKGSSPHMQMCSSLLVSG